MLRVVRNPGLFIALALLVAVLHSSCSQPEAPHGPDSTKVKDSTHKDSTVHQDTTVHKDSTTHPDTTGTSFQGILRPYSADTLYDGVAISGDGNIIAARGFHSTDALVYVFDANTGKILNRIVSPIGIFGLELDRTGRRLLVQGMNEMNLYNTLGGDLVHNFQERGWLTTSGDSILYYWRDNQGTIIGLAFLSATGETLKTFNLPGGSAPQIMSRDSRSILMFSSPYYLHLMDAATGFDIGPRFEAAFYDLHGSPDLSVLAGFNSNQTNRFMAYDARSGQPLSTPAFSNIVSFAILPDNRRMILSTGTTISDTKASIVDLRTGAEIRILPGVSSNVPGVWQFSVSDDGRRVAGAYWNAIRVWNIE